MVRTEAGFTVLELMLALAVAAILFGWGLPSIQESIRTNQVLGQSNELISIVNFAKSEAIRRNDQVPIEFEYVDGDPGWSASVKDPAEEVDVDGCEVGELRCSNNTRIIIDFAELPGGTADRLTFNNRGYIVSTVAGEELVFEPAVVFLQHEQCSGNQQRRRIDITPTGQVSSCALPCDSTAACP